MGNNKQCIPIKCIIISNMHRHKYSNHSNNKMKKKRMNHRHLPNHHQLELVLTMNKINKTNQYKHKIFKIWLPYNHNHNRIVYTIVYNNKILYLLKNNRFCHKMFKQNYNDEYQKRVNHKIQKYR